MPGRWLLKTEPTTYSFDDLIRDKRTTWDGVKNPQALNNLNRVQKGDLLFIYHTGSEKAVIGIARALSGAYPDPKKRDPHLLVIDLAPGEALPYPVTLAEIKANPTFAMWELVRLPRLSVMPVSGEQWAEIARMARRA